MAANTPGAEVWGALAAVAVALAVVGPRAGSAAARVALPVAVGTVVALAGLAIGAARVTAIDAGAFRGETGGSVSVRGFVAAVPRRSQGEVRVRVDTADGRLLVVAPEPVPDLPVGGEVATRGTVRAPADFEAAYLERLGINRIVEARSVELTGNRRGGLAGLADQLRSRAEAALERGAPEPEAALLRGFVLGQDDRIDPVTIDDFQRSGLAHLLAVSGQNVLLLALLAAALLGLAGVPLRVRLVCILGLIAVYVPVAGAGPSIQRAGVMGAAGVVAALASRPAARWYAMLLAAAATLALNPRATGDVGWQLSFAAVAGIALWTAPLRNLIAGGRNRGWRPGPTGARAAFAEGAAVTLAATVATAPLMAHHFERLSIASLPANLLALPAVAPAMWLGMLAGAIGQVPWMPVEPLTALAGLCAAYIEQVGRWLAAPGWAQLEAPAAGAAAVAATYALLIVCGWLLAARARARRALGLRRTHLAFAGAVALLVGVAVRLGGGEAPPAGPGLRVTIIDVGQGDAILLDPEPGEPILVDAGAAGAGVASRLRRGGVERLAAAVISHDQSDHAGGLPEVIEAIPVETLAYGRRSRRLADLARAHGVAATQVAEGSELRSGALRLEVLWPPRVLLDGASTSDPNTLSVVLLARWHRFEMLLTGDAEAEAVPAEPGPLDVLKIAHHGSADSGLEGLLDLSAPRLAVVSVGEGNPFGHPAPETLKALGEHGVETLRTDLTGDITIDVSGGGWSVHGLD